MPRLSIIVPHLQDDSGLESTLLSLLENRIDDCEILVAHTGDYRDPYGLQEDEVILIETSSKSSLAEQLNLATKTACSSSVQYLLPGATVTANWAEEALELMRDSSVSSVCVPVRDDNADAVFIGIDSRSLPHRRVTDQLRYCASPLLCGGVFRKKTLSNIGGWFGPTVRETAEVEYALMANALDLQTAVASESTILADRRVAMGKDPSYEIGHACGQLACAYGAIEDSGVVVDSVAKRLGHLASGLMSPKTVAERLGWVMGIRDRSFAKMIEERLIAAEDMMDADMQAIQMQQHSRPASMVQNRRAA